MWPVTVLTVPLCPVSRVRRVCAHRTELGGTQPCKTVPGTLREAARERTAGLGWLESLSGGIGIGAGVGKGGLGWRRKRGKVWGSAKGAWRRKLEPRCECWAKMYLVC